MHIPTGRLAMVGAAVDPARQTGDFYLGVFGSIPSSDLQTLHLDVGHRLLTVFIVDNRGKPLTDGAILAQAGRAYSKRLCAQNTSGTAADW